MSTHALTRIANDSDYIELHTRWDGFPAEIREDLKSLLGRWEDSLAFLESRMVDSPAAQPFVIEWFDRMKAQVALMKDNPTIEGYSALLACQRMCGHHVVPALTGDTKRMLEYWGVGKPVVTANLVDGKLVFRKQKMKVETKAVDKDFEVMRISAITEKTTVLDGYHLDIKVRRGHRDEVMGMILRLPQLYRNLTQLAKVKEDEFIINDHYRLPIAKINQALQCYYKGTSTYNVFSRGKDGQAQRLSTEKSREAARAELISTLVAMIPMEFSPEELASQLFFALPGIVQPMTYAEALGAYEPDYRVYMSGDRLGMVMFPLEANLEHKLEESLKSTAEDMLKIEAEYRQGFGISYKANVDFQHGWLKSFPQLRKLWLVKHEENLVDFMNAQRDIEIQELGIVKDGLLKTVHKLVCKPR